MADSEDCTVVRFSSDPGTTRIETVKYAENGDKLVEPVPRFGAFYAVCVLVSIVTYVLDCFLAVWLLYFYSVKGEGVYFALTLTFIMLPALLMTAFSMRWYIVDHDDPSLGKPSVAKWILRLILLVLQLAPLLRYCDTLSYGLRSRVAEYSGNRQRQAKLYRRMLDEDSNGALLRLFHCFLHAAPQAVVQLMILLMYIGKPDEQNSPGITMIIVQSWTVVCAVVSVAWSLTSYHRSVRFARDDKEKVTWWATVIAFCWNLMSVMSRVVALSLLASMMPAWMGYLCLLHWAVMSAWLALGHHQTAVCATRCEELLFSGALGFAYITAFIAPRDGPTRYSYLAYYLVCFMENTGALVVWCVVNNSTENPMLYYGAVIVQLTTFLLALIFMFVYYRLCHPSTSSVSKRLDITDPTADLDKPGYSKAYHS